MKEGHLIGDAYPNQQTIQKTRRLLVKTGNLFGVARMLFVLFALCAAGGTLRQSSAASVTPTFTQTNLVSDVPGMAMTLGLNSGIWISDNGSGKATTYDGTGKSLASAVAIPAPNGSPASPTGVATNATDRFVISAGGKSGPSSEIFATENGTIEGWN